MGLANAALPNDRDSPFFFKQGASVSIITGSVSIDFLAPELFSCCGVPEEFAVMSVPKASVYEHGRSMFWKDEIRFSS